MNLKIKRRKELSDLFFQTMKEEGLGSTISRTSSFLKRRTRRKKGRFLPPASELEKQRASLPHGWDGNITVVTALFNTDREYLKEYIDSFLSQSWQFGTLVLADASDEDHAYVGEYALKAASENERVTYLRLPENRGIALNTNRAVKEASGSYICFADHDDILSPDALFQMAKAVEETGARVIYSDEALFDSDWKDPTVGHFKPDYSYYYLTNCNYICHLVCMIRKEISLGLRKFTPPSSSVMIISSASGDRPKDSIFAFCPTTRPSVIIPTLTFALLIASRSSGIPL